MRDGRCSQCAFSNELLLPSRHLTVGSADVGTGLFLFTYAAICLLTSDDQAADDYPGVGSFSAKPNLPLTSSIDQVRAVAFVRISTKVRRELAVGENATSSTSLRFEGTTLDRMQKIVLSCSSFERVVDEITIW
jgi:hypothetical protein